MQTAFFLLEKFLSEREAKIQGKKHKLENSTQAF